MARKTAKRVRSYTPEPRDELCRKLGVRFQTVRKKQQIGLRPLADGIGVSINTIRWHEAGATMLRTHHLALAAAFLDVRPADLMVPP